jgi:phosphatidylinositol alpha-1,6-mannosyltransferase
MAALRQLLKRDELPSGLVWRVVGDGNDRTALEGTSEQLGLAPWVQFLGVLPDEALREELRHCSLLLMPSAYAIQPDGRACGEGFGIVYLEAAQAGRASIACREGGQADLIEHGLNGWLINPSADELASLLMELAANPQRLVCAGAAARQRARADFTPETFQAKMLQNLCLQAEAPKPCSQT